MQSARKAKEIDHWVKYIISEKQKGNIQIINIAIFRISSKKVQNTNMYKKIIQQYKSRHFLNLTKKELPREGKILKLKQGKVRRSHRTEDFKSLWDRPEVANKRLEEDHWKMDCMRGPKNKNGSCLLTMVDRKLRDTLIFKLLDQTQESVINVLDKM